MTTLSANRNATLATLNQMVQQQEDIYGYLTDIDNDGTKTLLTFGDTQPTGKYTVLAQTVAGQIVVPAGSVGTCKGTAFVTGQLLELGATHPT